MNIVLSRDAELCASIHKAAFAQPWMLNSFSALLASDVVQARFIDSHAFLLTRIVLDEMEILTLAVTPEMRRKGYAMALMRHALQDAYKAGVQSCFLEVDAQNIAAIRCYETLGFDAISTRKNYYATPAGKSDALIMRYVFAGF